MEKQVATKAVRLQLRVTEREAEQIGQKARSARLTVSAFCRAAVLGQPTPARLSAEQLRSVVGVANNLNQLTRAVHSGQVDVDGIRAVIAVLKQALL